MAALTVQAGISGAGIIVIAIDIRAGIQTDIIMHAGSPHAIIIGAGIVIRTIHCEIHTLRVAAIIGGAGIIVVTV